MKAIFFLLLLSLGGCAFLTGLQEAKNTPPAPTPAQTSKNISVPVPPPVQAPIDTNTPTEKAAKRLSPATF